MIGNPLIADASVQPGGVVVITAKSYGMTNLVALDRAGLLAEYPIEVIGPGDAIVVIYRGIERETYSCAPDCERRITLGNSAAYFRRQSDRARHFQLADAPRAEEIAGVPRVRG